MNKNLALVLGLGGALGMGLVYLLLPPSAPVLEPGPRAPALDAPALTAGNPDRGRGPRQVDPPHLDGPSRTAEPRRESVPARAPTARSCSGKVEDPRGRPLGGASVAAFRPGEPVPLVGPLPGGVSSASDGSFLLPAPPTGVFEIRATHPDWSLSRPVPLALETGERLSGIRIPLRRGGDLTGTVWSPLATLDAGRSLLLVKLDELQRPATSLSADAHGRFSCEHVPPGEYLLEARPRASESKTYLANRLPFEVVQVREGETTRVVLGEAAGQPVRLFGRVTGAGSPRMRGSVILTRDRGLPGYVANGRTQLDPQGAYELIAAAPGRYVLEVELFRPRPLSFSVPIALPPVAEFELNVAVPLGRIAGWVLAPDGSPAASTTVECRATETPNLLVSSTSTTTGSDGSFTIPALTAGSYTLRASGAPPASSAAGALGPTAVTVRSGLVLGRDQQLEGIVLRLERGSQIRGRVLDPEGEPAARASIFVRAAAGGILNPRSQTRTDAEGRFVCNRVGTGEFTVSACLGQWASQESAPLQVSLNSPADVELRLELGTTLIVGAVDAARDRVPFELRIFDEAGRRVEATRETPPSRVRHSLRQYPHNTGHRSSQLSLIEPRVGPLPRGRYRVEVSGIGGRTASEWIELAGEPEFGILLELRP